MMPIALFWLIVGLLAGLALVGYVIAADRQRFLVRFDLKQWRHSYYQRALPNFLQALHDNYYRTPWPAQCNAVAAMYFRLRTRRLLKKHPAHLRRAFLQQHITLFALLEILRPFLNDFVLSEQQRIAGERLLDMEDTIDRDKLIGFLDAARLHRNQFFRSLSEVDRETLATIINRRMLPTLRTMHAIYQEHGYSLMPEFTQLRRWEEMTGVELAQELPALPSMRQEKRSTRRTARGKVDLQNPQY